MKFLAKVIFGILVSIITSVLSAEAYVRFYVFRGGGARADYEDDYGMAFDVLLIAGAISIVTFISVCYFLFRNRDA